MSIIVPFSILYTARRRRPSRSCGTNRLLDRSTAGSGSSRGRQRHRRRWFTSDERCGGHCAFPVLAPEFSLGRSARVKGGARRRRTPSQLIELVTGRADL